jgi:short-subunit dehydrogenase
MDMHAFKTRYGDWGLVAGAAEGLGAAFAEIMAGWGMNVIMVDLDKKKLEETASRITGQYQVKTIRITADLSQLDCLDRIMSSVAEADCRLMVYNAAYGPVKSFLTNTPQELDYYMDLNARTPLHLVYRFLNNLSHGRPAGILIMSSLAGLWGTQLVIPYGATKAFDYNLAEGLYYELKGKHIDVMACCAGATDTPNYRSTNPGKNWIGPAVLKPHMVAEKALRSLGKKAVYIPGISNKFNYFIMTRILPRSISARLMNNVMFNMYRDTLK